MSDPIQDLKNFHPEGLNVNPLPASEVRRRGDRRRHRSNALAAIGGVAAVALIATPLALVARGEDRTAPQPAAPGVSWRQEVPTGFPLQEGLPAKNGNDGSPVTVEPEASSAHRGISFCGETAWSPPSPIHSVDLAGVTYIGETEGGEGRTLALYQYDRRADEAFGFLRAKLAGCPSEAPDSRGTSFRYETRTSDLGEDSLVYVSHIRDSAGPTGEMVVTQVVHVGNALLLDTSYGLGGGDPQVVEDAVRRVAQDSAGTITDLCLFSATPCGK